MYDDHRWVATIGDPGFRYHAAMTRIWGLLALRLANADVLPFDYGEYAVRLREFADEVEKRWRASPLASAGGASPFAPVQAAVARFESAASSAGTLQRNALEPASAAGRAAVNRTLMQVERAFIDSRGIPGRAWYRHQIYAPKFTYAPEILPGPAEALAAGDEARLREQCIRVAEAIGRAADLLAKK
jgi:N-acetylated-alpha-linked acidic dipeptidase